MRGSSNFVSANSNIMKKQLLLALAIVFVTGMVMAQQQLSSDPKPAQTKPVTDEPVFEWDKTVHDFGKIPQGKPVTVTFNFKNAGKKPLILTNVSTSCGCTVADYTKESVLPGKSGYVKLTYNAASMGAFNKSGTVSANTTPKEVTLAFKGEVVAP